MLSQEKNTKNFLSVVPPLYGSFDLSSLFLAAVVSSPLYWLIVVVVLAASVLGIMLLLRFRKTINQEEEKIHTLEHLREGEDTKTGASEVQKKKENPAEVSPQKNEYPLLNEKKERGIFNVSSFLARERTTQSLVHLGGGGNGSVASQKLTSLKALADAGFSVPPPLGWNGNGALTPDARLLKYVGDARKFGMTDEEITQELTNVGWDTPEINSALAHV